MTVESDLFDALSPLVDGRVFPLRAEPDCEVPYITYQQVGGRSVAFLESGIPSRRNGRFQINVWSDDFQEAATLMRAVHDALVPSATLRATALGEPIARIEDEVALFGAEADFSIWF
jgi:hypothetical protein